MFSYDVIALVFTYDTDEEAQIGSNIVSVLLLIDIKYLLKIPSVVLNQDNPNLCQMLLTS